MLRRWTIRGRRCVVCRRGARRALLRSRRAADVATRQRRRTPTRRRRGTLAAAAAARRPALPRRRRCRSSASTGSTEYKQSIDEIAALGADTRLARRRRPPGERQQQPHLPRHAHDADAASSSCELIKHAKSKKLRVILMPIVLLDNPRGNEWRGTIKPRRLGRLVRQLPRDDHPLRVDRRGEQGRRAGASARSWSAPRSNAERVEAARSTRSARSSRASSPTRPTGTTTTSIPFWDQLDLIGDEQLLEARRQRPQGARSTEIVETVEGHPEGPARVPARRSTSRCSSSRSAGAAWRTPPTSRGTTRRTERADRPGAAAQALRRLLPGLARQPGPRRVHDLGMDAGRRRPRTTRATRPKNKPAEKVLREWLAKPRGK